MTKNNYTASLKFDIINICIGENIRKKREKARVSAKEMAQKLHISLRLYHKYETGISEIPHNIVWQITTMLGLDINQFFDELPLPSELEIFNKKEAQKLLWCFQHISRQSGRDKIFKLMQEMSELS